MSLVLQLPLKTRRRERSKTNEVLQLPPKKRRRERKKTIDPLLLCITKLAQARSSTTLYYKACTKSFPVLLCTTKLAQTTSQYYSVTTKLAVTTCFPQRHGDVSAAKRTRFCSFPHRHGDARGQAEADVLQLPP